MDLNKALNTFYEKKIKINQSDRVDALDVWQILVRQILEEVERTDSRFSVQMLYTGSFYERVKTQSPDEFDLMLVLKKIQPEISRRVVDGFTFVKITNPESVNEWRRDNIVASDCRLDALQMRAVFSRLVSQAVRNIPTGRFTVTVATHGPAVTLTIKDDGKNYDIDLTLAVKVPEWPSVAYPWRARPRGGWPTEILIQEICQEGCHVVAKQPKEYRGDDKRFLWRFSFSEAEKSVMTKMDSGNPNSGRRRVLQILKTILTTDPQLKPVPLRSYHMKTLLFWESEKHPSPEDWGAAKLGDRFLGCIDKILKYVRKESLPHYFLNNVNLFAEFKEAHFQIISRKFEGIKRDPVGYFQ